MIMEADCYLDLKENFMIIHFRLYRRWKYERNIKCKVNAIVYSNSVISNIIIHRRGGVRMDNELKDILDLINKVEVLNAKVNQEKNKKPKRNNSWTINKPIIWKSHGRWNINSKWDNIIWDFN